MAENHGRCEDWFALLSEHADEELDPEKAREVCAHLEHCRPCLRYLESLKATRDSLSALDREGTDPSDDQPLLRECLRQLKSRMAGGREDPG